MSPWLDAVVRFGLPLVGLWIVSRALWPLLLRFIDSNEKRLQDAETRVATAQAKAEASAAQHYVWSQEVIKEFAALFGKYNETNAETARQLKILVERDGQRGKDKL